MLKHLKYFGLLVFAAFLLRLTNFLLSTYITTPDGASYTTLARKLAAGNFSGFLDPYWSPLFPFVTSFFTFFSDSKEFPGIAASMFFGCLLPITIFFLVKQHYGVKEGYLSGAIAIIYPFLIEASGDITPDHLYIFLICLAILFGWQALKENNLWKFALVGLLLGFSYLTRPEAVIYLIWFSILALLKFSPTSNYKQRLKNILFLFAGFIIPASPYLIYLRVETGVWTISGKFKKHIIGGIFYKPEQEITRTYYIVNVFKTLIFNLDRQHKSFQYLFPPFLMMISALGLFRAKWTTERFQKEFYFLSFFATTVICYAVTVVEVRYLSVTLPILFAWLAKGFFEFRDWLIENFEQPDLSNFLLLKNRFLYGLICVSLVFIYLLPTVSFVQSDDKFAEFHPIEIKKAGVWLKENTPADSSILSDSRVTAFYADKEHEQLSEENSENQVLNTKADFLVIYERSFKSPTEYSAEIEKLAQSGKFEIISNIDNKIGYRASIFRVKK
ncbi:MAG: glycosyltransferase family 39 protein [Aridibacter sp.]